MKTHTLILTAIGLSAIGGNLLYGQQSHPTPSPVGFIEQWVLAKDRAATLSQLVPGTEDYFFFHALHYQQTSQTEKFKSTMQAWDQKFDPTDNDPFGSTSRYTTLKSRAVIIDYQKDPQGSIKKLSELLKLKLDHQRPIPPEEANIPNTLDPQLISKQAFRKDAEKKDTPYTSLYGALLIKELQKADSFDHAKRRWFLKNYQPSSAPEIPRLVLAELRHESTPSFDQIPGTSNLLLEQLIWLEKQHSDLQNQTAFVTAVLARFRPGDAHYLRFHPKEKRVWLERSWKYAAKLPLAHHPIKRHILYALLENHLERDSYPKDLLFHYLPPAQDDIHQPSNQPAIPEAFFKQTGFTRLKTGHDKTLIHSYLIHLLGKEQDLTPFSERFEDKYLAQTQAEAKLLAGADSTIWGTKLSPEDFRALRDRTEVTLARSNAPAWSSNDVVTLQLDLKNTPQLNIRIFKLDGLSHIRRHGSDPTVETSLNGLVPHDEQTIAFKQSPLLRHRHTLQLPQLKGRGLWIIECISKGVSCRSLIRKGSLNLVTHSSAEGQVATLFDETNQPAHPATLWIQGKAYATDAQGRITLPFVPTQRKDSAILVAKGPFSTLATSVALQRIQHNYDLQLHAGTSREQLIAGKKATLLIRPELLDQQTILPLGQLKNARIHISAQLAGGIHTEISDIPLVLPASGITQHPISLPEDVRSLKIVINGEIENSNSTDPIPLSATSDLHINQLNDTKAVAQPQIALTSEGWQIELLGRNGEPLKQHALPCTFSRDGFINDLTLSLRTDQNGQIHLGGLQEINSIRIAATKISLSKSSWLGKNNYNVYKTFHALEEETLRIPNSQNITQKNDSGIYQLILHHGDPQTPVASMNQHLVIKDHELVIQNLPAGHYKLYTHGHLNSSIRILKGQQHGRWITGTGQTLESSNPAPLYIPTAQTDGQTLTATLKGDLKQTRVIAVGTRYYYATEPFKLLESSSESDPTTWQHAYLGHETLNGKTLSDEYRYILERRNTPLFVGNQLTRPGLLLNPWKDRESEEIPPAPQIESSGSTEGGITGGSSGGGAFGAVPMSSNEPSSCYDFLAHSAVVQTDLNPAADGTLTLSLKDFPHCQSITLIALDGQQTATRTIPLPAKKLITRERRLDRNLDPTKHYTGTRATAILRQGASAKIENVLDADWRAYTSLSHVYDYFHANQANQELKDFSLLMQWSTLDAKQRLATANILASHEFNLFVYFKDRKWFNTHIKPLLVNKRHRTFIDDFLLKNNLTQYLSPWRYQQLNAAEKALLARAIPAQKKAILNDLRHSYALRKPSPERETLLFASALKQNSLALRDRLGITRNELALLEKGNRHFAGRQYIQNKLNNIIIPLIHFENTTVEEALDVLRLRTREIDPDSNGLSFIIRNPALQGPSLPHLDSSQIRIKELKLRDVPLGTALQYICDASRLRYRLDQHAIVLLPLEAMEVSDLITRTLVVPPDFIAMLQMPENNSDDPFASTSSGSTLSARKSTSELLKENGVAFPDKSFANYIAQTSNLVVRNTAANIDIIEQILESVRGSSGGGGDSGGLGLLPRSPSDAFDGTDSLSLGLASDDGGDDPFGGIDDGPFDGAAPAPMPDHLVILDEAEALLTHIWSESHYYRHPNLDQGPKIKPNRFWIEWLEHDGQSPFLSARFPECTDSTASMLIALALLDLPFEGEKPDAQVDRLTLKVKAKSPMLLFYRDTRETQKVAKSTPLLVHHNFFRFGDRTRRDELDREVENPVTEAFLTGVRYTASFMVTNPTGTPRELQVLCQIPRGAIALGGQPATQARDIQLAAHATTQIEYDFYFPTAGTYPHFPAHVLEHDIVQASAVLADQPVQLKVIEHATHRDTRSWAAVARDGNDAEVLARLGSTNLHRTPLKPILWRLSNKTFFDQVMQVLREQLHYSAGVYAYGFKHADTPAVTTYLENALISHQLGGHLDTPLLKLDNRQQGMWQHLEFAPLINPRQHPFQGQHVISNQQVQKQYHTVLEAMSWKKNLSQDDLLTLTYHLFLQDRVGEALHFFAQIQRKETVSKMQYDYLHCYALFYQEKPAEAATIAARWASSSSSRWPDRFAEVIRQAKEIAQHTGDAQSKKTVASASQARSLKLIPSELGLTIQATSIDEVTLKLYSVDLEVLFSENPFLNKQDSTEPSIEPNQTMIIKLDKNKQDHQVKLPVTLRYGNALAVVEGEGLRQVLALDTTAHQVNRQLNDQQLTVTRSSNGHPLPRCYVKVYIETVDGKTTFYKDGYTDLRGRFPYKSHTGIAPHLMKRYSIFTSHPQLGSKITTFQ